MSEQEPTEREFLEGLRYEDKFPHPDRAGDGQTYAERLALEAAEAIECMAEAADSHRAGIAYPDGYEAWRADYESALNTARRLRSAFPTQKDSGDG